MGEREQSIRTLIERDFNARTGEEGGEGGIEELEQEEIEKSKSKDKKLNKEEKKLIKFIHRRELDNIQWEY